MSRAIALGIYPLSRAKLILEVMTVRMSAVDLEARKPYWKSLKRPLFSRWATRSVLMTDSDTLLIMLRRLIGRYCEGSDWPPEFLKTGQTEDSFQQSGKHSSWMHLLNNFARIGESSGDKFFWDNYWDFFTACCFGWFKLPDPLWHFLCCHPGCDDLVFTTSRKERNFLALVVQGRIWCKHRCKDFFLLTSGTFNASIKWLVV